MAGDFYSILGIARDASGEDIKKAYRRLSKELHPDKHKGNKESERRFKEVNEAYEALGNPEKRRRYDQFGSTTQGGGPQGGAGFGGFDFSGFQNGEGFADIFESFFGGGAKRTAHRGADREIALEIDLQDVLHGAMKSVSIKAWRPCRTCSGNGAEPGTSLKNCSQCGGTGQVTRSTQSFFGTIQQRFLCDQCKGSGKIPEHVCKICKGEGRVHAMTEVAIDIPAGIEDGQSLRLKGKGDAGRHGDTVGDLYVAIHVRTDPRFQREKNDIRSMRIISVVDAILGTTVQVDTLDGPIHLRIPEGSQPGQVFRFSGKGLPELGRRHKGDHYVTVHVEIPKKLSREERRLVEEWKKTKGA